MKKCLDVAAEGKGIYTLKNQKVQCLQIAWLMISPSPY